MLGCLEKWGNLGRRESKKIKCKSQHKNTISSGSLTSNIKLRLPGFPKSWQIFCNFKLILSDNSNSSSFNLLVEVMILYLECNTFILHVTLFNTILGVFKFYLLLFLQTSLRQIRKSAGVLTSFLQKLVIYFTGW